MRTTKLIERLINGKNEPIMIGNVLANDFIPIAHHRMEIKIPLGTLHDLWVAFTSFEEELICNELPDKKLTETSSFNKSLQQIIKESGYEEIESGEIKYEDLRSDFKHRYIRAKLLIEFLDDIYVKNKKTKKDYRKPDFDLFA